MPLSKASVKRSGLEIPTLIKTNAASSDYFIGIDNTGTLYKITKADLLVGLSSNNYSSNGTVQPVSLVLLHGEGTNNGTSIIDSSSFNRVATKTGNPVTSTIQKKFGTASLYFDGASNITFPSSTDFNLNRNNFAIQCWVYPTSVNGTRIILDRYSSTVAYSWQFGITNGRINFYIRNADASTSLLNLLGDTTLIVNVWHYVGVRCVDGIISLWVNGEIDALAVASANLSSSLVLTVGKQGNASTNYFQGYIDDLRLQKLGVTDMTTIPTSAFA